MIEKKIGRPQGASANEIKEEVDPNARSKQLREKLDVPGYGQDPKAHAERVGEVFRPQAAAEVVTETAAELEDDGVAEVLVEAPQPSTNDRLNQLRGKLAPAGGGGGSKVPDLPLDDPFPPPPPRRGPQGQIEFIGERLKFDHVSGQYTYARTGDILPVGTVLAVTHYHRAWVRFDGPTVVDTEPFIPGQPYKTRDELTPARPPRGQADQWRDTLYLYCADPNTHEEFTFYHAGGTGLRVLEALILRIRRLQTDRQNNPLVEFLAVNNPAKGGYSAYWSPAPKLVGWIGPDGSVTAV